MREPDPVTPLWPAALMAAQTARHEEAVAEGRVGVAKLFLFDLGTMDGIFCVVAAGSIRCDPGHSTNLDSFQNIRR